MVFTEVNCLGDHDEGGWWVQGCCGIVSYTGMSDDVRDCRVGGRHGRVSVTVEGEFESNFSKNEEVTIIIPGDNTITITWPIRLQ